MGEIMISLSNVRDAARLKKLITALQGGASPDEPEIRESFNYFKEGNSKTSSLDVIIKLVGKQTWRVDYISLLNKSNTFLPPDSVALARAAREYTAGNINSMRALLQARGSEDLDALTRDLIWVLACLGSPFDKAPRA